MPKTRSQRLALEAAGAPLSPPQALPQLREKRASSTRKRKEQCPDSVNSDSENNEPFPSAPSTANTEEANRPIPFALSATTIEETNQLFPSAPFTANTEETNKPVFSTPSALNTVAAVSPRSQFRAQGYRRIRIWTKDIASTLDSDDLAEAASYDIIVPEQALLNFLKQFQNKNTTDRKPAAIPSPKRKLGEDGEPATRPTKRLMVSPSSPEDRTRAGPYTKDGSLNLLSDPTYETERKNRIERKIADRKSAELKSKADLEEAERELVSLKATVASSNSDGGQGNVGSPMQGVEATITVEVPVPIPNRSRNWFSRIIPNLSPFRLARAIVPEPSVPALSNPSTSVQARSLQLHSRQNFDVQPSAIRISATPSELSTPKIAQPHNSSTRRPAALTTSIPPPPLALERGASSRYLPTNRKKQGKIQKSADTLEVQQSDPRISSGAPEVAQSNSGTSSALAYFTTRSQRKEALARHEKKIFIESQKEAIETEVTRRLKEAMDAQAEIRRKEEEAVKAIPPGKKRKRRPSPDIIPNPVGSSYGMDLDYFGWSSDEEDEEDTADEDARDKSTSSSARPPKRARMSYESLESPSTPTRPRGLVRSANQDTPCSGTMRTDLQKNIFSSTEKEEVISPPYGPFVTPYGSTYGSDSEFDSDVDDRTSPSFRFEKGKESGITSITETLTTATASTTVNQGKENGKDSIFPEVSNITTKSGTGTLISGKVAETWSQPPPSHPNPSHAALESEIPLIAETLIAATASTTVNQGKGNGKDSIFPEVSNITTKTSTGTLVSGKVAETWSQPPPPRPSPSHAALPSNVVSSSIASADSDALARARSQALRYTPLKPSGLRASSRLSNSTVASPSDIGDSKNHDKREESNNFINHAESSHDDRDEITNQSGAGQDRLSSEQHDVMNHDNDDDSPPRDKMDDGEDDGTEFIVEMGVYANELTRSENVKAFGKEAQSETDEEDQETDTSSMDEAVRMAMADLSECVDEFAFPSDLTSSDSGLDEAVKNAVGQLEEEHLQEVVFPNCFTYSDASMVDPHLQAILDENWAPKDEERAIANFNDDFSTWMNEHKPHKMDI